MTRLAYDTAFFGESAARFFPDRRLFRALWITPYFEAGAPLGFVAERGGEPLGYILGAVDDRAYRRAVTRLATFGIALGLVRPAVWRTLPYLARLPFHAAPHAPIDAYPAHLHVNLVPEARGHGLGGALVTAFLGALAERGVPGVQLSTTRENAAALRLYERLGFSVYLERPTALWTPWLGRETTQVVMVRRVSPSRA